jgi:DNA-binding Lrp family transcriptional regulator
MPQAPSTVSTLAPSKRPAFQFYPGDWMKDPALRACSLPARGLWVDMICLMVESPKRGFLVLSNGASITNKQLARMTGCTEPACGTLVTELEGNGVFSRDEQGTIYSRRIVRDEEIRSKRAEGGKLGGNPALKVIREVDDKVNLPANLPPTPSSSTSSSSSSSSLSNKAYKASAPSTEAQREILARYEAAFGVEWKNDKSKWRKRVVESDQGKALRVISALESDIKEGKQIRTRAGYAEELWKSFAPTP